MRIAQISTLATPVCRDCLGSVEQLVWLLTRELTSLGHAVTVFAAAGSETAGETIATLPGPYATNGSPDDWQLCEWINLCRAVEQSGSFDVLHSHAYLWGLPLQRLSRAPMAHTMHILPEEDSVRLWRQEPDACVTAISAYQWSEFPFLQPAAIVPHGLDLSQFTFHAQPDDYVCYLGRFTWGKGPEIAISMARTLGLRLLLAGPADDYFRERIEPLVDGHDIVYVGPVSGANRNRLLGEARALLYPLRDPEPFGLVQIEAMACGTPVAALDRGAVREIIDPGLTGYYAASEEALIARMPEVFALDRAAVRRRVEERFSARRMATGYAQLYERIAAGGR